MTRISTSQTTGWTALVGSLLVLAAPLAGAEGRAGWNHDAARAKVRQILNVEKQGQPWDDLSWRNDPKQAAREAAAKNKPIFLFVYLKTDSGPLEAPC
ncbi:MAG: hypothetical protein AAF514_07190 [Verrucomicrobiota bacterium]